MPKSRIITRVRNGKTEIKLIEAGRVTVLDASGTFLPTVAGMLAANEFATNTIQRRA